MIPGVKILLGEREYVVPPLNFRLVRELSGDIEAIIKADTSAGSLDLAVTEKIVKVVHAAILRNYPEVPISEIENGLDLRNSGPAMAAILGASGFELVTGEAQAPQSSADQSTGTTSTAS